MSLLPSFRVREKENARLREILDVHGIEYESFESKTCNLIDIEANICFYMPIHFYRKRLRIFHSVFQGRDDVFAKRWYSSTTQKLAINLYARENGIVNFAINENINVRIVPTGNSLL